MFHFSLGSFNKSEVNLYDLGYCLFLQSFLLIILKKININFKNIFTCMHEN